jgi:hypothetical protein
VTTQELAPSQDAADDGVAAPTATGRWWRRCVLVAPYLSFVVLAFAITVRLWVDNSVRLVVYNPTDHIQFLWFFSNAAWDVSHLHNPLLTDRLNVPGQVNLMGNTSVLGLGIPLSPITLLFGPSVTFAVAMVLTIAGTAAAWFWVLQRHFVSSRLAAYVGAGFLGFAPAMISQASGHPNLTAMFVIPFIIVEALRLRTGERLVRHGVILGLLITYQMFLNEEVLFLLALALAAFVIVYAVQRPREALGYVTPMARGLAVAGGVALVLLAYPLYVQFFGPGHYRGLPPGVDRFTTDLASYTTFARQSIAGNAADAERVTLSSTEENAFYGWPLVIFILLTIGLLWRRVVVRALFITALGFVLVSLGPHVTVDGHKTHIPAPLRVLGKFPPFDLATATRYALVTVPIVGIILTYAVAGLLRWSGRDGRRLGVAGVVVAAVLLPVAPKPIPAVNHSVPAFITSGAWKQYVDDDHTLVSVPVPRNDQLAGMRWAAVAKSGFKIPRGYFMGPSSDTDTQASWIPPLRPTSELLANVTVTGDVPPITDVDRDHAREDLRYWKAAVVVLDVHQNRHAALLDAVEQLLGPAEYDAAGGVWLWDVRGL